MQCPFCNSYEHKVVDKRSTPDRSCIRRRRGCQKCGKRFTTYERVELSNLVVIKKDGKREPFSREKLQKGIYIACQKRPISTDEIQALINKIEMELRRKDETEIKGNVIGNYVMKALKKLDKIAYIRFASVYRDFADIEEFQKELTKLNKTDKKTNKGETGRK